MKLTNKEAADVIMRTQILTGRMNGKMLLSSALLKAVEVLRKAPEWIEIKYRRLTDEEFEEYKDRCGDMPELWRENLRYFDCELPEDGQVVLVTTNFGEVQIDTWFNDGENCYFENYCDDGEVIAWMPLADPFEKEGESDADS